MRRSCGFCGHSWRRAARIEGRAVFLTSRIVPQSSPGFESTLLALCQQASQHRALPSPVGRSATSVCLEVRPAAGGWSGWPCEDPGAHVHPQANASTRHLAGPMKRRTSQVRAGPAGALPNNQNGRPHLGRACAIVEVSNVAAQPLQLVGGVLQAKHIFDALLKLNLVDRLR